MPVADEAARVCSASDILNTAKCESFAHLLKSAGEAGTERLPSLTRRGGAYLSLRYAASVLVSLANMFVLTWWIGPRAYGIFVTTVSFTGFLASLSRLGIDAYLVRCEPAPDRKQYNLAFTLILATSTLLGVGGISLTPLLRYWYADGALVTPYLVLLLSVPLNGLAGPPTAKLERELKFRAVAGIEFGSQLAAFAVSISLAWRGAGVWAPVAGMFVWQFLALVVACRAARLRPRLVLFTGAPKRMLAFGFGFSASMRIWQLRSLVNPVLVGHFAGVEGVAFVAIAIRIVESLSFVRTAAGRLALATLARLQQDRQRFQNALESAMRCQLLALGPLLCGFALCGPWLVHRFMGDRWMPALHVYPFIAAGVLVNSLFSLQASALFVGGHYWPVAKAYASHVGLLAAGTFLLVPQAGLTGYGWAELFACGGYTFIHSKMSKVVSISYRRLIPWLAVFLLPLLAQAAGVPLFRVMVLSSLGVAGALTWQERRLRTLLKLACKPPKQNSHRRRIVTFVEKTRARGWPYVAAVGRYKLRSAAYVVRRASPLPQRLLTNSDVLVTAAFHFAPEDIPRIVASVPAQVKIKTLNEADRFLAQSFCFRGREYVFSGKIDWNFCPDGNFSWRWDLNRHAFFLNLATAYYYSQRPEYRAKLLSLWLDWMVQNPVARGPAWRYPFEVAARLQNWIWSYFLLAYSGLEQKGLRQLAAALVEHAEYLDAHLEYHWPNNHLLLEAKALYQFAILFPEAGKHFCRRARAVLEHEVLTQILPDGVHSELSSMYHRIIAGELWELALLCRRQRNPLSAAVEERVQRMQEFSRAVLREDGTVPLLGDSALHDTYLRFDSARQQHSDLNYWLCWNNRKPFPQNTGGQRDLHIFPEAGYAFFRKQRGQSRVHLTFDAGPLSRCPAANHAHCDALSFELHVNSQPVIVDPGLYFDWQDGCWQQHFRATGSHNTLMIDGKQQSELSDSPRDTARTRLLHQSANSREATVIAECIPYWVNGEGIRHTREIRIVDDLILVRDVVSGSGRHLLEWSFQFAPEIEIVRRGQSSLSGRLRHQQVELFSMNVRAEAEPRMQFFCGHRNPLRGWVSRNTAQVLPAPVAVYSLLTELPFEMETSVQLRA